MLVNNLTLDEEDAVQEEFKELQALAVSSPTDRRGGVSFDTHIFRLSVPDRRKLPNSQTFQTRNPSVSRLQVPYRFPGRSLAYRSLKNPNRRSQFRNGCPFSHRTLCYLSTDYFSPVIPSMYLDFV